MHSVYPSSFAYWYGLRLHVATENNVCLGHTETAHRSEVTRGYPEVICYCDDRPVQAWSMSRGYARHWHGDTFTAACTPLAQYPNANFLELIMGDAHKYNVLPLRKSIYRDHVPLMIVPRASKHVCTRLIGATSDRVPGPGRRAQIFYCKCPQDAVLNTIEVVCLEAVASRPCP
ncbi:hypothetical protein CERSUDRAFT_120386 [Gelatoporia subvermispora B]|uniref:Uncharacterized protein n=1 Tax=Ceriporiopsis subvermispora (strain B) TaxID=914234 RepID=M2QX31_CERS8|nr:hypothetical protein CERSUDRAFT_120386 [Gelatoporia subvermispora B]